MDSSDIFGESVSVEKGSLAKAKETRVSAYVNATWYLKHRCEKLSDLVLPQETRNLINTNIGDESIENMTFYSSSPGTGKTTTALAIVKQLGCRYLNINASIDGNIETIKTDILTFGRIKSIGSSNVNVVIFDEADGASEAFFKALRGIIETNNTNLRFILTCNNLHKIPTAITSRCTPISFSHTDSKEMKIGLYKRLKEIAYKEVGDGGIVEEDTLKAIAKRYYPDMRSMLNAAQFNFAMNSGSIKGTVATVSILSLEKIWNFLKEDRWEDARVEYNASISDPQEFFGAFLNYALLNADKKHRSSIALAVAEFQYRSAFPQVDPEINVTCGLLNSITRILKS